MNIETFTQKERGALHECVAAIRASATYELPEFEKIFGSTKEEIEEVYATFPNWDLYDETPSGYDASGDVIRNTFALLLNDHEEEKKAILATLNFDLELIPHLYKKLLA
jgi:hypothetical protein